MKHIKETLVWLDKRASQCEAAAEELRTQMIAATMKGASLRRAFEALKETCPKIEDPNELTIETIEKSERGEGLHEVSNAKELMKELKDETPASPKPTTVALADQKGKMRGVSKKGKKWQASAYYNKERHYLGMFDTQKEAGEAVRIEERIGREDIAAKGKPTVPLKGSAKRAKTVIPAGPRPCTWECNKCGRDYPTETGERPDTCEKCGKDHGFTRLR